METMQRKNSEMTTHALSQCVVCNGSIERTGKRSKLSSSLRYCSNACRQRAYRHRSKNSVIKAADSSRLLTRLSSFVGRSDELVELRRLLRSERLLTLTGPAGAGKSRLALELALREQRSGRREVVFAELGSLMRGDSVEQHVAALLASAVRDRTLLLVLDTCEHVLDECGQLLSELLPNHPEWRVLATSREPLRIPGEMLHSVTGLPLPDIHGERQHLSAYMQWDSVRLFCERAQSVEPGFQITQENAEQIGRICARVDGLPLAIELAAGLVGTLPLVEIHDGLDDSMSLLNHGWRTSERRHQSLRAAFGWSYDLLTPAEQKVFRRVAVLPGGFGLDAAAAVHSEDRMTGSELRAILARLAMKSLITPCAGPSNLSRFRMLEPVRCYGYERLHAEGEQEQVYDHFAGWLAELATPLQGTSIISSRTLERLKEEQENLRHALDWLSAGHDERQLLLAGALGMGATPGVRHHASPTTRQLISSVLERADTMSTYRSIALEGAAVQAVREGERDEAVHCVEQAVELERQGRRFPLLGRLMLLLSLLRELRGERTAALADLQEYLRISRRLDDELMTAVGLSHLARHCLYRGDLTRANKVIGRALPVLRTEELPVHSSAVLHTAGSLALEQNRLADAEKCFVELLQQATDDLSTTASALEGLAIIAVRKHQFERGLQLLAAALAVGPRFGDPASWWQVRVRAALTAAMQALPAKRSQQALALGRGLRPHQVVCHALGAERAPLADVKGSSLLSEREWDVIGLLMNGLTNRQIASRLFLSVRTVETHIRNIRATLGLRSRAHLAAWAAQQEVRTDESGLALRPGPLCG
ncbi:ATP-binding protein [Streptomyces bluensis]|uniref:ATP-binding protein n=1 Tax=Streptomyces bluensis TaxID=33897 RepID=UPI001671A95C|nr:LuxR C-terminal-related transcriptional regulator [Streptomyces bluensis]